MFRNDPQRLSISVLISTLFEALSLLETAALLRVFPLGASTTVAGFGPACRLFDGFLTLIALHFPPLTADELEQLFFAPRTDGFLRPFGRYPETSFATMGAAWMRRVLFTLNFAKAHRTCRHEEALKVWLENRSVFWNAPTGTARLFHVKITRPNTKSVGVMVHVLASCAAHGVFSSSRRSASLEQDAVDDTVFARAGRDAHSAFVRLDDGTLDQDVSSNVVGVGSVLNHAVNGAQGRLPVLRVVDAHLVGGHHADHGVATGFAVDLPLGFANEGELLLSGNFGRSLAACLNLASTGWFAS